MNFYTTTFYIALSICIIGIICRISAWFFRYVQTEHRASFFTGIRESLSGIIALLTVQGILRLFRKFLTHVLLQMHILKEDRLRWFMHMSICYGFFFLLFFHALDDQITVRFFPGYVSTLNPFMFFRNLAGFIVICGIGIAVYLRLTIPVLRETNRKSDWAALLVLFLIMFSGFLLESVQIISPAIFHEMALDYAGTDEPDDILPLKSFWAKDFGVVFPEDIDTDDPNLMEEGKIFHEESCSVCHVKPDSAFVSFPLSKSLRPFAKIFDTFRADHILWYVHILICFAGLAWLPFSKFFHIISTPLNLLKEKTENTKDIHAEPETVRALGMDACTHCGICSQYCSVAPVSRVMGNPDILPSEKLASLKKLTSMLPFPEKSEKKLKQFAEGSFICTECGRCTELCPSGINLQELWQASKKELLHMRMSEPHRQIRKHTVNEWAFLLKETAPDKDRKEINLNLTGRPETFWACVQCTICTNVCPVVAASENPESDLDLTPQQIMNLMRLQMIDMALGARMVWDCVTCYMCQEHCPQGVRVADVLYELRNMASERMRTRT
ncbi:MAG: 4Fe-4S dicluster domain-containing protein [Desulfococcaceae bacterium]